MSGRIDKKKIGIVLDAYKLKKYREALYALEFDDREESQILRDGTVLIGVYVKSKNFYDALKAIKAMCKKLEKDFKYSRQ